jgi:NAD(P)-dependent dehydrogenase (short-subunit alcohol dehydrogenase family)
MGSRLQRRFADRTVVITGGGSGIGLELGRQLASCRGPRAAAPSSTSRPAPGCRRRRSSIRDRNLDDDEPAPAASAS